MIPAIAAGVVALAVFLLLFAVCSLILRMREKTHDKRTVQRSWLRAAAWLFGNLPLVGVFFTHNGELITYILSMISLFASCAAANWRICWNGKGFQYRTAFRRKIPYEYGDVCGIKYVGTGKAEILLIRVEYRLILLDSTADAKRFVAALDSWREGQGLPSVMAAGDSRWKEAYLRHGPFRRKLDRIRGGTARLAFMLAICIPGAIFAGAALVVSLLSSTHGHLLASAISALMTAFFILVPVCFIRAVSRMDAKTLNGFFRPAVIRPDPLEEEEK